MGALNVPPTVMVEFDDGTSVELVIKPRDVAVAERDFGHDFTKASYVRSLYAMTLAALARERKAGKFEFVLPETIDLFIDSADVLPEEELGKDSDPDQLPG